ncbi:MAG TPA: DUF3040 domain-containing protein [Jatrophihabitans sp.]|nr:DUF3040 domain-containing protein [Jatrophihabitans sp.]
MPLSEHEQRLLDEIEQALYAEDPKFASSVRSARPRNRTRLMVALSAVGVLLGLAVVLVGLTNNLIVVGVLGFIVIVGSCVAAASALRGPRPSATAAITAPANQARQANLRSKMEDRMRRRFEEN